MLSQTQHAEVVCTSAYPQIILKLCVTYVVAKLYLAAVADIEMGRMTHNWPLFCYYSRSVRAFIHFFVIHYFSP